MHARGAIIAGFALAVWAGGAQASEICRAQAPAVGTEIRGPVLHIPDGDHLCVALGETPDRWLEVRLADTGLVKTSSGSGESPRKALMGAAFARNVTCRILERGPGGATAACAIDGRPLGAPVRQTPTGDRVWR